MVCTGKNLYNNEHVAIKLVSSSTFIYQFKLIFRAHVCIIYNTWGCDLGEISSNTCSEIIVIRLYLC